MTIQSCTFNLLTPAWGRLNSRRPGPLTVEISMPKSFKWLKSQPSTLEGPDTSETQTERPEILTHWLQAQKTQKFKISCNNQTRGHTLTFFPAVTHNTGQPVDNSKTKPGSDIEHLLESPATPAEFTHWYNKVHLQARSTKQMVDSETEPELEILEQELKTPIDFIYKAITKARMFDPKGSATDISLIVRKQVQRYTTKSKAQESGSEGLGLWVSENSKGMGTESVGLCPETREYQGKQVTRVVAHDTHQLPVDPEQHAFERQLARIIEEMRDKDMQHVDQVDEGLDDDVDIDVDVNFNDQHQDGFKGLNIGPDEDDPDLFLLEEALDPHNNTDFADVPPHLLTFHLPRVACNALLAIFACLLISLSPAIDTPFITLQSSNRVLGVDKSMTFIPLWDLCTCTKIIKYPYLPLSEQLKSLLKIPGLEAILDAWRLKPQNPRQYTDIFDGDMCSKKLQGADSKLFFSNLPHEKHGPDGRLRIGLNLRVDCILPGPKEQNPNQIQCFLHHIISDLLHLWKFGVRLPMESCQIVHVILVAVVCDKPAVHKIGGFASHSHTHFCTCCWIKNEDKDKPQLFQKGAFEPQSNMEQWDLEQIVVDPMHNLFLGLVKTHFYNIWVQSKILHANHKLDTFHVILHQRVTQIKQAEIQKETMTNHKAQQKKALEEAKKMGKDAFEAEKAQILQEKLAAAEAKTQEKLRAVAAEQAKKSMASKKRKAITQIVDDLPEGQTRPSPPAPGSVPIPTSEPAEANIGSEEGVGNLKYSLHPDDPANFLKLCTVLCILIKCLLSDEDIDHADRLIHEYNTELIHVLKSFKTNNHANSKLETTFFREFHKACEVGQLTYNLLCYPKESLPCEAVEIMLKASNEERGTVAGLAALSKDLEDAQVDDQAIVSHSLPLDRNTTFFDYVIINGRHYYGSRTVLKIFQFNQNFCDVNVPLWLAHMCWFVPWNGECEKVWVDFAHADVHLWVLGEYCDHDTQLPLLIDPDWIVRQLGMTTVSLGDSRTKVWASIEIVKV
ncbi:hypothetical protein EDB19DRAFT_1831114 [Suillus lakei]|nr:hypothetical protein EDB19DRAFT_1831114 [Suillus lakei]